MSRPSAASRGSVRPRYGRLALASSAAVTTTVSVLGGLGLIAGTSAAADTGPGGPGLVAAETAGQTGPAPQDVVPGVVLSRPWSPDDETLPDDAGPDSPVQGRRVVYSESRQQVWLVGDDEAVERTYLVSGSVYDNLDPGAYEVYSRSEQAWGIDDSGTMKWFVRFTTGDNAAIGFHDIPRKDGETLQTRDELGTPTSHGCIRQRRADAVAMWRFAPIGTPVVVTD